MEHKPHIALVPFPGQGHIAPLIYLATKLAANGFIITLINIDSIHTRLSKQWSDSPPHVDIRLREVTCDVKMPQGFSSEDVKDGDSALAAFDRLENEATELLRSLEPSPCCLVADFFITWGTRVANSLSMCPVTYWPGNAAWSSLHQNFSLLVSRGDAFRDETDDLRERVVTYVPGIESLKLEDLPDYFRRPRTEGSRYILDLVADRMKDSEWTLVNSMVELEPRTFKAMEDSLVNRNFVSIGPLFPLSKCPNSPLGVSLRDEDDKCLSWLDTQAESSVLYISFGSIGTLSGRAFEDLAAGVEASEQPFLWVIRIDQVVEESKEAEKFKEFVNRTRRRGLIVSWAPQVEVLAHSSVGGFLSHCGWNSTFESICHGVPILGWPLFSEQNMNCKLVAEDWRVGKWFSKQLEVGREQVEEKIREFMQGADMAEMRSRVSAFRDMARRTASQNGASHTNLQEFMTAMKRQVSKGKKKIELRINN